MIAHLVQTGFGAFYDGVLHVLVTVEDLLLVLVLSLLGGLHGRPASRGLLVALPAAWLLGAAVGTVLDTSPDLRWPTTASFSLVGALVAANARVPRAAVLALGVALGALHGYANGVELQDDVEMTLAGIGLTVFTLTSLTAATAANVRAEWARIAVRVAGSWAVAVGLLMIGWAVRR